MVKNATHFREDGLLIFCLKYLMIDIIGAYVITFQRSLKGSPAEGTEVDFAPNMLQDMIWGISDTYPASADPAATLKIHDDFGKERQVDLFAGSDSASKEVEGGDQSSVKAARQSAISSHALFSKSLFIFYFFNWL